jgi:hypothetical protein
VNVVPTGKAIYIGLDISGSMGSEFTPGSGITCAQAGAALCLVTAKTEETTAFTGSLLQVADVAGTAPGGAAAIQ